MKEQRPHIEEEVRKTLEVADRIEATPANPFLWTRVEAAIQRPAPERVPPTWQFAVAAAIVLLNFGLLTWDWQQQSQQSDDLTELESIWDDYSLNLDADFLTYDQIEPS